MTNTNYGLYRVQAKTAWTGDQWGNEWLLGWVVVPDMDSAHGDGEPMFALYEDDGRGNGDYVASFNTLAEAKQAADRHVAAADGDPEVAPFFPVHEGPAPELAKLLEYPDSDGALGYDPKADNVGYSRDDVELW